MQIKGSRFNSIDGKFTLKFIPQMRMMRQQHADPKISMNASQKLPHAQPPYLAKRYRIKYIMNRVKVNIYLFSRHSDTHMYLYTDIDETMTSAFTCRSAETNNAKW